MAVNCEMGIKGTLRMLMYRLTGMKLTGMIGNNREFLDI